MGELLKIERTFDDKPHLTVCVQHGRADGDDQIVAEPAAEKDIADERPPSAYRLEKVFAIGDAGEFTAGGGGAVGGGRDDLSVFVCKEQREKSGKLTANRFELTGLEVVAGRRIGGELPGQGGDDLPVRVEIFADRSSEIVSGVGDFNGAVDALPKIEGSSGVKPERDNRQGGEQAEAVEEDLEEGRLGCDRAGAMGQSVQQYFERRVSGERGNEAVDRHFYGNRPVTRKRNRPVELSVK